MLETVPNAPLATYAATMARGIHQQSSLPFSAVEEQTALALHKSPAQLRLDALEKERERLLKDIAKKKAARDVTEHAARDAASVLDAKVRPVREAFFGTLTSLREIFTALLGSKSRLNRRDKAKVRRLYSQILPDLAAEDEAKAHDGAAGDDEPPRSGQPFGDEAHGSRPSDTDAGYSATKPSEKNASSLRALFRKLAVALHPDKVQDAKERETLTSVMKEVTRAYETGDVARLLEIEREWLVSVPTHDHEDEIARRIAQLLQANKELRRQLRALTAEVKELKQSVPGMEPTRRRGANASFNPTAQVQHAVEEMERELAQLQVLRDFAQSFLDGEMDLAEFMLGPPMSTEDDDPFEQLLAEMLEEMMDSPGRRPSRRAGRRRR